MEVSIFLAKFWGWYLVIFFFVLSYNPRRIQQIFEDLLDQKFTILAAFLAILVGLISVLLHNIWEPDFRIIVTLLGWGALLLGLLLFILPSISAEWISFLHVKLVQVIYVLLFLAGMFLLNSAYQIISY